ncbi:patatin-like phospholipase family protein [Pedobacter sp. MR2016-24]|uniref:patatin-like phospholipase family protein n=1 Tax=Pedobacter sp. MR2016-24 TaxID=2994466 RepID=UPI0022468423|nr:patatin-like phospholipase family protein [Pedobacter sp. MR2016-24]MCX2483526.1 patatin-like phospholipase family protein [Pedobacter sp. MR2016-24]
MKKKTVNFQNCLGVFQGGGCRGAAFVGAYTEAHKRGVSFSEIVGTSAGAIVAAFIAAGAGPEKLAEIIKRLEFTKLLAMPVKIDGFTHTGLSFLARGISAEAYRVVKSAGAYNSSELLEWIDKELRLILDRSDKVQFKHLIIPLTVVATDLKSRTFKLYSSLEDPEEFVADAVRNSCNLPIFFQPIDKRYVDGGVLSNLPSFVFKNQQESTYEKVLAFTLASDPITDRGFTDIKSYLELLATTSIDGGVDIQLALQKNVHMIVIPTGKIQATDFKTITAEDIVSLIESGEKVTADFFDEEIANIKSQNVRPDVYIDPFKTNNDIALASFHKVNEVIVSEYDTEWCWELFPTIVKWLIDGAKITVLFKQNNDHPSHGPNRKSFLKNIGCELIEVDELPMRGIIINGLELSRASALVYNEERSPDLTYHSKAYYGEEDFKVINLLREACLIKSIGSHRQIGITAIPISDEVLFDKLRTVRQYSGAEIKFEVVNIDVEQVIFITRYVRGFKYRQIENLFHLFKINNVDPFVPAKLVLLDGNFSIIAPPIIEQIGNKFFVIEGNTRLTYAKKNNIKTLKAVIVHGVIEPLPSSGQYNAKQILITDKETKGAQRYDNWNYTRFRKIESAIRNSDQLNP